MWVERQHCRMSSQIWKPAKSVCEAQHNQGRLSVALWSSPTKYTLLSLDATGLSTSATLHQPQVWTGTSQGTMLVQGAGWEHWRFFNRCMALNIYVIKVIRIEMSVTGSLISAFNNFLEINQRNPGRAPNVILE